MLRSGRVLYMHFKLVQKTFKYVFFMLVMLSCLFFQAQPNTTKTLNGTKGMVAKHQHIEHNSCSNY